MEEKDVGGYSVAYRRDDVNFPIYLVAMVSGVLIAVAFVTGQVVWLGVGVAGIAFTYYNLPLLETGRPTIGANQYGIFIQSFGLVRWRAVERIDLIPVADRAMTVYDLQIGLKVPLPSALVADWRKLPLHRMLMRLPWSMDKSNVIHVNVEPFDHAPEEIHRTLLRMWRYYRS